MLQSAPKSPWVNVKKIVEEEFGCKIEEIFSEFEQTPIASASLAQVHRATIKATGEKVAVKVQHMWIKE